MKNERNTKISPKHVGFCVLLVVGVLAVALATSSSGFVLFVIPCMLMMGATIWMMMGGRGSGTRGGDEG